MNGHDPRHGMYSALGVRNWGATGAINYREVKKFKQRSKKKMENRRCNKRKKK